MKFRQSSHIRKARNISRTLGTYRAARYLRARGWSLEGALHILVPRAADRMAPLGENSGS
jgi:hypothetical protein